MNRIRLPNFSESFTNMSTRAMKFRQRLPGFRGTAKQESVSPSPSNNSANAIATDTPP